MKTLCGAIATPSLIVLVWSHAGLSQTQLPACCEWSSFSLHCAEIKINANPAASNAVNNLPAEINNSREHGLPFYRNLFEGAKASLGTWEIAAMGTFSLLEKWKPRQSVALPAFSVDYEITEELARNDGKKSIGAVKPTLYPSLAATSRFAGMVLLDVFGGQNYSPAGYAKLFRFHQALYSTKVVTFLAKRNIQRRRPDGSDTYSFFSGHASSVFATSTFLYLEVNDFIDAQARRHNEQLPLFSPRAWKMLSFGVLYGWAGYVGYSRIHDKKHYLSDVVAGAFCGSMISYLFYPHEGKSGNDRKIYLGIQPVNSGASIGVGCNF